MAAPDAGEVIRDWEQGHSALGTTLNHCQQVALYLYPDRADFTTERTAGQKRLQYVFDSTPIIAHEMGAAGLHSMFTSDTLPWFLTEPEDPRLAQDEELRAWFEAADLADYATFNSPGRNFAPQSHQVYMDILGFGSACMAVLPGQGGDTLFSTRHLKECVPYENEEDRVDKLCRKFEWTATKAHAKWGDKAGEKVAQAVADNKGDTEKFWFHHRVQPRRQRDPQRADNRNKPYESVYVAEADKRVIEEGGFDIFPYRYPRLHKIPSEVMGRGRGMLGMPDIKMLNALMKIYYRHGEKTLEPPLMMPDDGFIVPIKTVPGAHNYFRAGLRPTDRIAPIPLGGDMKIGLDMIAALRTAIRDVFYNSLLLSPTDPTDPASAGKGVTATFTAKQQSENMRALSALNSDLNAEWAAPLVEAVRYYNFRRSVMRRFGPGSPYPPPPDKLRGVRWHARFKSPIALAQRAAELTAIDQIVQRQVQLRQIDPDAPMILDSEAVMRLEGRDLNVPAGILKSSDRLAAELRARLKQEQEQHQAQMAEQGSGAVVNLAQARRHLAETPGAATMPQQAAA